MRINEDCIRDVLSYLIENLTLKLNDTKGDFEKLSMYKIIYHFQNTYSKEDVWYSLYNLEQERYIETNDIRKHSITGFAFVDIFNVTHKGHNFYESIRPQPVWDKTKSVLSKIGIHSLKFIESIAHDVAVEISKEAVKIVMTGQG